MLFYLKFNILVGVSLNYFFYILKVPHFFKNKNKTGHISLKNKNKNAHIGLCSNCFLGRRTCDILQIKCTQ